MLWLRCGAALGAALAASSTGEISLPWRILLALAAYACCALALASLVWLRAHQGRCTVEQGAELLRAGAPYLLVCGGEPARDVVGARLALLLAPRGLAFFSSGHCQSFQELVSLAGLNERQAQQLQAVARLDREALDTVSNVTSFLGQELQAKGPVVDVVVLTSEYHARRVQGIASLLLAARGLSFRVAQLPSDLSKESGLRCVRDLLRACMWLAVGLQGDVFAGLRHRERLKLRERQREKASKALKEGLKSMARGLVALVRSHQEVAKAQGQPTGPTFCCNDEESECLDLLELASKAKEMVSFQSFHPFSQVSAELSRGDLHPGWSLFKPLSSLPRWATSELPGSSFGASRAPR